MRQPAGFFCPNCRLPQLSWVPFPRSDTIMPKKKAQKKAKAQASKAQAANNAQAVISQEQASFASTSAQDTDADKTKCSTLLEDEYTRCSSPPTDGYPQPNRCREHHKQYRKMTQKYKLASQKVDEIAGSKKLPSSKEIQAYRTYASALDTARWVREYLEAIRSERTGRELHHTRFFLKVDAGHRKRLEVLAERMIAVLNSLDEIQKRAYELYTSSKPPTEWFKSDDGNGMFTQVGASTKDPIVDDNADEDVEDLIDLKLRAEKESLLSEFDYLLDHDTFIRMVEGDHDHDFKTKAGAARLADVRYYSWCQYARRYIFHEPSLALKAVGKVSFKDLFLDGNFSIEDTALLREMLRKRLELGLVWMRDATIEALAVVRASGDYRVIQKMGDEDNCIPILGGWVFNNNYTGAISDEAWWHYLKNCVPMPANIENRFVRSCNSFDDLISFLTFGAMGMTPTPSRFTNVFEPALDSTVSRNVLSMCGVAIADAAGARLNTGPIPTTQRARRRGFVKWVEAQTRAYCFGAVRDPPDDFATNFLHELSTRPDTFFLVTHATRDADTQRVETFGGAPEDIAQMRNRTMEVPLGVMPREITGRWEIIRSATDILFAKPTSPETSGMPRIEGYLTQLVERPGNGGSFFWFFRHRTDIKYFVALDAKPGREDADLMRELAWAALKAKGLASGALTIKKFIRVAQALMQQVTNERMAWIRVVEKDLDSKDGDKNTDGFSDSGIVQPMPSTASDASRSIPGAPLYEEPETTGGLLTDAAMSVLTDLMSSVWSGSTRS